MVTAIANSFLLEGDQIWEDMKLSIVSSPLW